MKSFENQNNVYQIDFKSKSEGFQFVAESFIESIANALNLD